jgi:hypothetical protein
VLAGHRFFGGGGLERAHLLIRFSANIAGIKLLQQSMRKAYSARKKCGLLPKIKSEKRSQGWSEQR